MSKINIKDQVKNIAYFSILLITIWISIGIYLFFISDNNYIWTIGELGDYFGGGIGAVAVLSIVYTMWIQHKQINEQKEEMHEAGVFRVFQALKFECEGLSARIISKVIKSKLYKLKDGEADFQKMLKKFHQNDRTVFLRAMQKDKFLKVIKLRNKDKDKDKELKASCERFRKMLILLDNSLEHIKELDGKDFTNAIKSTEIYQAYKKCLK
jgi:hypothetical protein